MSQRSSMTIAEHTTLFLTSHFHVATTKPIELKLGELIEFEPPRVGRYLAYDFLAPSDREITFSVLIHGEVKITINGVEAHSHRQVHMPGEPPADGWHVKWHEIIVWPEQLIDGWVRIGIENPAAPSTHIEAQKICVCSGASLHWTPSDTPSAIAERVDTAFTTDGSLSDPAWKRVVPLPLRKTSLVKGEEEGELRFLYGDQYLYMGFRGSGGRPAKAFQLDAEAEEVYEEDIHGLIEVVRLDVFNEEFIHLILDPGANGQKLLQLIVNASCQKASSREVRSGQNRLWESDSNELTGSPSNPLSYPGSGLWHFDELDLEQWQAWATVRDDGWSACLAIPFSVLGKSPTDGDVWHFNAIRRTYGDQRTEYFASPHPDMPHNPNKFAQLIFGRPKAIPVSADFGTREPGRRTATVKVASRSDQLEHVGGRFEVDGTTVPCLDTAVVSSQGRADLEFDLTVTEQETSNITILLTDEHNTVFYRSAPIEFRLPRPVETKSPVTTNSMEITIGATDDPKPWNRKERAESFQLFAGRGEQAACQIGVTAGLAHLSNVRVSVSDLTGANGAKIGSDRIEQFVVGTIHREPNPAFLLRREIPSQRQKWVPDVLVPVDAFAIQPGESASAWVEVNLPTEVPLGRYTGSITVSADGIQSRSIPLELSVTGFPAAMAAGVLDVGTRRQHFIDNYLVGDIDGAVVRSHPFEKLPDPLFVADSPGELPQLHLYGTILQHPDTGRYRMWYLSHSFGEARPCYHVCYAESDDGLHWEKPELGIREFEGSTKNNLIDIGEEMHFPGPSVVYRPNYPEPAKRYVRYFQSPAAGGTCAAYSADGIHWEYVHKTLIRGSDAASASYDPRTGQHYFVTIEEYVIGAYVRRSPAVSVSEDGEHWSEFRRAVWADARDDRDAFQSLNDARETISSGYPEHFHAEFNDMRPYPFGDLYLASVTIFECCGADIYKGTYGGRGSGKDDCVTYVQLLSSRSKDLSNWQRVGDRRPVIARGLPGSWDSGFLTAADAPIIVGDELWMYFGASNVSQQHEINQYNTGPLFKHGDILNGIGLARMRLDGFVSVDADHGAGKLITKPLRFPGRTLEVNAIARSSLRVAVLDETGRELPGLGVSNCDPVKGDSVRHRVHWDDENALRRAAGQPVQLAFHLEDASLYAFQFRD